MSLMHLLAVGRSIGTIRDQPTRYKMTQQNLLPRFGPVKEENESAPESRELGSGTSESLARKEHQNAPEGKAGVKEERQDTKAASGVEAEEKMTQQIFEQRKNSAERLSGVSGPVRKVASPWMGWSLLNNPFKSGRRKGSGPVQGELALDMIRPVRNDLNDTDLEIIASARRASLSERSQGATAREWKLGQAEPWWRRVWNRLWRFRRQT